MYLVQNQSTGKSQIWCHNTHNKTIVPINIRHQLKMFPRLFIFRGLPTRVPPSIACDDTEGELFVINNNDKILIKREPLVYTRARCAVQMNLREPT